MNYQENMRSFFTALIVACFWATIADATPITLAFEAHIYNVDTSVPFDPGFNVSLGDKITGQFTYEPQIGDGISNELEVTQPYSVELVVDGHQFTTPPETAELTLTASDNLSIIDFPPATTIDTLDIFSFIAPADPAALPNIDPSNSLFRIRLRGNESVLSHPELPADVDSWNAFEFQRQVSINLRGVSTGSFFFDATIDSFSIVPEPTSAFLGTLTFTISAMIRRNRR